VVLSLTQNGAKLQSQFAFKSQTPIPGTQGFSGHKSFLFEHFQTLFQVGGALIQHRQLLETHRHIVARDEGNALVTG
jgi:hypothetical protein